jgi:hypothetical protein
MSQASVADDVAGWHKRFAMSCNNRAWELSVQPRTPSQDLEMLNAAHASAWHWAQVGTELNRMRATMLLAEVHSLLGHGQSAFSLAREMQTYFLSQDTPDWKRAFTHAVYAHAAYAAGHLAEHRSAYTEAADALRAIADDEDRIVVAKTLSHVPPP